MWYANKTDTRLFCGFRKTWLRIAIATEEKKLEAERHDASKKNQ